MFYRENGLDASVSTSASTSARIKIFLFPCACGYAYVFQCRVKTEHNASTRKAFIFFQWKTPVPDFSRFYRPGWPVVIESIKLANLSYLYSRIVLASRFAFTRHILRIAYAYAWVCGCVVCEIQEFLVFYTPAMSVHLRSPSQKSKSASEQPLFFRKSAGKTHRFWSSRETARSVPMLRI